MAELAYGTEAAAEYDRAFSHVSARFLPALLRAARLAPGQRVLDAATGTGIAAEAALALVGSDGSVLATDASPEMVERARHRLASAANAAVAVEDAQRLSLPDGGFDAVLCSLGLMFFPDPARGVGEFHRVLRPGGRAAVSVLTTPERSYNGRINVLLARHAPAVAEAAVNHSQSHHRSRRSRGRPGICPAYQRRAVRRATPATLTGVAGRPTMASAVDVQEP